MKQHTLTSMLGVFIALATANVALAQFWLPAPNPPKQFNAGSIALQLTDGTIMVQQAGSASWWKLTPDDNADYTTGTWSALSPSIWNNAGGQVVYAPEYFASAVLKDGRVIVMGGEYLAGQNGMAETTLGAIFDPTKGPIGTDGLPMGTWTPVPAPTGWKKIGDAPSIVLPSSVLRFPPAPTRLLSRAVIISMGRQNGEFSRSTPRTAE
jgi:hypothetical protein